MRRVLACALVVLAVLLAPAGAFAASTTVLISEFRTRGPNGANDEFIELFNISNATINIGGYAVRMSDSSGNTTLLAQMPASFSLLPKHFFLLVNVATQGYSGTTTGNLGYSIGVPDDGGIAVLNKSGVVLDQVGMSSGSAYKEGTPLAPMTASVNQSYERNSGGCASTTDTDDNSSDFHFNAITSGPANSGLTCAVNPCTGITCKSPPSACYKNPGTCVAGTCTYAPFAPNDACNDGNACTVGDTCDASLNCISGAVTPCNTPPADFCSDANTLVKYAAAGTCSTVSGCSYTSSPINCPFGCDGGTKQCKPDPCTTQSCGTAPNDCNQAPGTCTNGKCVYTPFPSTTTCSDGNPCTVGDTCDGAGKCVAGGPKAVDDGEPCTVDACDATTGTVTHTAVTDGTNCDDGDLCNGIATCSAGKCTNGAAKTCTSPPVGGCYAATGVCNPTNGACTYQPSSPDTNCSDGDACTLNDKCDGNGVCGGSAVVCTPGTPLCFDVNTSRTFSTGTCQAGAGTCSIIYDDKHCDFGCDTGSGLCKQDPCIGVVCNQPPSTQCYQPTGTCAAGKCSYTVTSDAACDDGDSCTNNDKCSAAGACGGTPLACNSPPLPKCKDANTSTQADVTGTCSSGTCSYTLTDVACSFGCDSQGGLCNGDPCKTVTCDSPPDQCHQSLGTCSAGNCTYELKASGATCDDADPCTTSDVCSDTGQCKGTTMTCNTPLAPKCDATNPVSHGYDAAGTCDKGVCTYTAVDKTCAVSCDTSNGLCKDDPCAGVACKTPPGSCYNATGTCDKGTCSYATLDTSVACDDSDACTKNDGCDGKGKCKGEPVASCAPDGGTASGGAGGASGGTGGASNGGTSATGGNTGSGGATSNPDAGLAGHPVTSDAGAGHDGGAPTTISGGGSGSCGCSVPRSTRNTAWPLGLLALSVLALRRRRR